MYALVHCVFYFNMEPRLKSNKNCLAWWPIAEARVWNSLKLEYGPMPNVMVALPNIGDAVCSTTHFGWRSLLECRTVSLPRRESRWNLQGCPKLANRSQPLVGQSSPYYEDMWRRYRCLTIFFRLSIRASATKIQPNKLCDGAKMAIFCVLYFQRAACSTFQTCILNSH